MFPFFLYHIRKTTARQRERYSAPQGLKYTVRNLLVQLFSDDQYTVRGYFFQLSFLPKACFMRRKPYNSRTFAPPISAWSSARTSCTLFSVYVILKKTIFFANDSKGRSMIFDKTTCRPLQVQKGVPSYVQHHADGVPFPSCSSAHGRLHRQDADALDKQESASLCRFIKEGRALG